MEFNIPITRRIKELVAGGVITIGAHITRDGQDVWARFTRSYYGLGIRTHISYTLNDAEELSKKISLMQQKFEGSVELPFSLKNSSLTADFKSVEDAIKYSESNNLNLIQVGSIRNMLPHDSLHPKDFTRGTNDLYARACSVASKITSPKLVSRINTQREILGVSSASNLAEWWSHATPIQRLRLLARTKNFWKEGDDQRLTKTQHDAMESLQCPFQDAETQMGRQEEELSAKEEDEKSTSAAGGQEF
jgi:hypothetical protein